MKFYQTSRIGHAAWTVILILLSIVDLAAILNGRRWLALLGMAYAGVQLYSLWNRYWEITQDGMLRSKGYGFTLTYRAADLRYAGPVRKDAFPVSRKGDVELELEGVRAQRYARVAERSAFLERLQRVSPTAEVVSL